MHSLIDIIGGLALGLIILAFWLTVHEYVDTFVTAGKNGKHARPLEVSKLVLLLKMRKDGRHYTKSLVKLDCIIK